MCIENWEVSNVKSEMWGEEGTVKYVEWGEDWQKVLLQNERVKNIVKEKFHFKNRLLREKRIKRLLKPNKIPFQVRFLASL